MRCYFYRSLLIIAVLALVLLFTVSCQKEVQAKAFVKADGTLERGQNVQSVVRTNMGRYTVTFEDNVNVENGYYLATPAQYFLYGHPPVIMVVKGPDNSVLVYINKSWPDEDPIDCSFYLVIL